MCVPPPPDLRANRLLRDLPTAEHALLGPHLTLTSLVPQQQLYDVGESIKAVWFPLDSMISQVAVFAGRAMVEVNTVGRDGMAGLPVVLGVDSTPHAALCQVAGRAVQLPADAVAEVLPAAPELQRRIAVYNSVNMVQLGQNAACLGRHPAPKRAARWLLTAADRTGRDRVDLTQEFFAQMLGVRRATVSEIARGLQEAGLISYRRGVITTIDRAGLVDRACACYPLLQAQDQLINAL